MYKIYACAEGGAHLPIAHALHLPDPTNKPKSKDVSLRFAASFGRPQILKYVEGKRKEERIMQSLVATMSALARKPCVRTHYVRTKKLIQYKIVGDKLCQDMLAIGRQVAIFTTVTVSRLKLH